MSHYYLARTACDVLRNMRECDKTKSYSPLAGLIAEAQIMVDKMEAALIVQKDLVEMNEEWSKLKKELKILCKEKKELKGKEETNE